ncbi:MAG TPA: alkaline phosphatase family protein [Chryseosolibacter sp.]
MTKRIAQACILLAALAFLPRCAQKNTGTTAAPGMGHQTSFDDSTLYAIKAPFLMPYNRVIDGAGESVSFGDPDVENHSLDAILLPDGKTLAVQDRFGLAFFNADSHKLMSEWSYRKDSPYPESMSAFSGLKSIVFHDSTFIFTGAGGRGKVNSYVMQLYWNGERAHFIRAIPFEALAPATIALPNEVWPARENGELFLYAVLNGNNRLAKVNVSRRKMIWSVATGMAPFGLRIVDDKAFVTNWAGPVPDRTDGRETAGIPWGSAYVDPKTGAIAEGSVSVIHIADGAFVKELKVGLHPNAIISSPDQRYLYVANGNSDHISVIDAQALVVVDSVFVGLFNSGTGPVGSTPNALAISGDGKILYVANGMDNAICVVSLGDQRGKFDHRRVTIRGYIPTEAYPSGIVLHDQELCVTNLEATGARAAHQTGPLNEKSAAVMAYNSHKQLASVSFIPLPGDDELKNFTGKVRKQSMAFRLALSEQLPRTNVAPRPVPERIGEPAVFKHVLYIIKENRTYDQVFGDLSQGRGEPSLCIFGDSITPNQHQLARDFVLLDNYYASGKASAEGHHWVSAGIVTDYTEKSVRAWFRSYPHVLTDAMVYDKKGLIWNNALDHGKTVRIYGEACSSDFDHKEYDWTRLFKLQQAHGTFPFTNTTTISRIRPVLAADFPGGADQTVNDQMRADAFIRELEETAAKPGDQLPDLMVMALPNDHTAGMNPKFPTPRAMVADNDLAVGRIVEAVRKSRFADSTVIFITEDDSQGGWDHISSYRTTGLVISSYSRLQKTVSTNYNQTSMLRTIEQILGLPPMNVIDATALPMFDCFSDIPDHSFKYKALANRVPLDEMNPAPDKLRGEGLRFTRKSIEYAFNIIDRGNDDLLNRILWFSEKGGKRYPAKLASAAKDDDDEEGEE